jgi:hypothetical protein
MFGAGAHQRRHFLHRAGTQHGQRLAGKAAALVGEGAMPSGVSSTWLADGGAALLRKSII